MKKFTCVIAFVLFSICIFSQSKLFDYFPDHNQKFFIISDYNNNFKKENTYSLGFLWEVSFRNDRWSLNIQDNIGATSKQNFYAHTSMATLAVLKLFQNVDMSGAGEAGVGLLYLFIPTVGVTYYINNSSKFKLGVYLNPLCYDYIGLSNGKEISASVIESGIKMIKTLNNNSAIYFSVGSNYSTSIGSKLLLPKGYSDGSMLNVRIGFGIP